jgi:hypothetical protein
MREVEFLFVTTVGRDVTQKCRFRLRHTRAAWCNFQETLQLLTVPQPCSPKVLNLGPIREWSALSSSYETSLLARPDARNSWSARLSRLARPSLPFFCTFNCNSLLNIYMYVCVYISRGPSRLLEIDSKIVYKGAMKSQSQIKSQMIKSS